MRIFLIPVVVFSLACTAGRPMPETAPRISPDALAAGLAEADRMAARGCYLCLKEAAAAYAVLLERSSDSILARKALENRLMIAVREIELRIPDSGARAAAQSLQPRVPSSYAAYFAALDSLARPARDSRLGPRPPREERVDLAIELEKAWPGSAMKAYFYIAMALNSGMVAELKPQIDAILGTHSEDLSLQYRMQAFLPTSSEEASRALLGKENGFAEVHFLLGQRAVLDARLADAYREIRRARELLPDSASMALVLADVNMAYARYSEALDLFDRVLAAGEDDVAQLGRAKALSYLGRHLEAIAVIDGLLTDLQNNPGEKYYWRAWNYLRLAQTPAAYEDAVAALRAMRNNGVYRLAGVASFGLNRLTEARDYFNNALKMNRSDCEAQRYLGQIDSVERSWKPALTRFSSAAACYDEALARKGTELLEHEKDLTGLSNGLITSLRAEIKEAQSLRAVSVYNADLIARSIGFPAP
jgi:tetratricopeptide (TPR) repeat protein